MGIGGEESLPGTLEKRPSNAAELLKNSVANGQILGVSSNVDPASRRLSEGLSKGSSAGKLAGEEGIRVQSLSSIVPLLSPPLIDILFGLQIIPTYEFKMSMTAFSLYHQMLPSHRMLMHRYLFEIFAEQLPVLSSLLCRCSSHSSYIL